MRSLILCIMLFACGLASAQTIAESRLVSHEWVSDPDITGQSLDSFDKIGLSAISLRTDTLGEDCTVWTFKEYEVSIQSYTIQNGFEKNGVIFKYSIEGNLLFIYNDQDSVVWKYKLGVVSSGSYILLMRD